MLSLTTLRGMKGFSMYLDGKLVAELNPSTGASSTLAARIVLSLTCCLTKDLVPRVSNYNS